MLPKSFRERVEQVSNKRFKQLFILLVFEVVCSAIIICLTVFTGEQEPEVIVFGYGFSIFGFVIMIMSIIINKIRTNKFIVKAEKVIKDPNEEFEFTNNIAGVSDNCLVIFNTFIFELKEIEKVTPNTRSTVHLPIFIRSYDVRVEILLKNGKKKNIIIYTGATFLKSTVNKKHGELIVLMEKLAQKGVGIG